MRPVAVVLDNAGDAQFDRNAVICCPERFDQHRQALLGCDPSGVGDRRRVAAVLAGAQSQRAEVADRAGEEMDPFSKLGGGVGQQRAHVLADHHDPVDFSQRATQRDAHGELVAAE